MKRVGMFFLPPGWIVSLSIERSGRLGSVRDGDLSGPAKVRHPAGKQAVPAAVRPPSFPAAPVRDRFAIAAEIAELADAGKPLNLIK